MTGMLPRVVLGRAVLLALSRQSEVATGAAADGCVPYHLPRLLGFRGKDGLAGLSSHMALVFLLVRGLNSITYAAFYGAVRVLAHSVWLSSTSLEPRARLQVWSSLGSPVAWSPTRSVQYLVGDTIPVSMNSSSSSFCQSE
eukprot:scaffold573081_cov38-Prasinocladus_malaysianus.AAC.1